MYKNESKYFISKKLKHYWLRKKFYSEEMDSFHTYPLNNTIFGYYYSIKIYKDCYHGTISMIFVNIYKDCHHSTIS